MQNHNLLENKLVYIEYGAGRAGLSSYVAQRLSEQKKTECRFVIVDRDTRRRKLDKNFREEYTTQREKMDIADFDLQTYLGDSIPEASQLICIAKHLCGGATDLSLTSILKKQSKFPVGGVAIATCCHHQCDAKTFVNLEELRARFSEQEITILPRLSSWAITVGTSHERKKVGFRVKRILDYCRILWMREVLPQEMKCGAI